MGYCIDAFLEDSSFEKACEDFIREGKYKSEEDYEPFSEFLFQEFARIYNMERPKDCDERFEKYKMSFIQLIFKAITGGESENISLGERLSLIFYSMSEKPISLKYVDSHNAIVTYEYPFSKERFIDAVYEGEEFTRKPGGFKDQIKYDLDCFNSEE